MCQADKKKPLGMPNGTPRGFWGYLKLSPVTVRWMLSLFSERLKALVQEVEISRHIFLVAE